MKKPDLSHNWVVYRGQLYIVDRELASERLTILLGPGDVRLAVLTSEVDGSADSVMRLMRGEETL